MTQILLVLILLTTQTNAQKIDRDIIDVSEIYGGFYILFDDNTSKQCARYGGYKLLGFNCDYFVVESQEYYIILDSECEVYGWLQTLCGKVHQVTSNSIVVRDGDYLKTYDMRGNFKGSRQVF